MSARYGTITTYHLPRLLHVRGRVHPSVHIGNTPCHAVHIDLGHHSHFLDCAVKLEIVVDLNFGNVMTPLPDGRSRRSENHRRS